MSRYLVDKFLYQVDRSPSLERAYIEDPAGFVDRWEVEFGPWVTPHERVSGHQFTPEEKRALATVDVKALYAMGAHPFLLWSLMLPVLLESVPTFKDAVARYASEIASLGRPDWST